uniref:Uncharacterized protein n=1 Tax=viral metagenome TaxID=1070528 RepID=A0A6C0HTL2_9ZZZZ
MITNENMNVYGQMAIAEQQKLSLRQGNHAQIRNKLQYFIHTKKIPNLIFHGEPQSGKRTLLNEFLHNIYMGDRPKMKTHIMTVECCHGKGIKFIREELKFFAKAHIQSNCGANFKSIVLLNADSLTIDAQSALRRCIELFSHNTRFFIVVENKERLLNPILSRFCEIYVSGGKRAFSRNPYSLQPQISEDADVATHIRKDDSAKRGVQRNMNKYQEIIQSSLIQPDTLVKYAIQWCEDGWCVYDWMNCLSYDAESNTPILSTERLELLYLIRMCYYKIKPDFRCEKMLMFYLLYFTLISSKEDLKNMLL